MTSPDKSVLEDSRPSRITGREISAGAAFCLSIILFGFTALLALFLQIGWARLAALGFSGFFVPDALSLEQSVHLAWEVNWDRIPNIRTFLGTVIVYFPVTIWGEAYSAVINVMMLSAAAALFSSLLTRLVIQARVTVWAIGTILVSTNLYVVSCIFYPNKEIPLILLTTLAIWGVLSGRWAVAIASAILCFFFRDGYGLIMGMVMAVCACRRFTFATGGAIATAFLLLLFIAFPISDLSSVDHSLQRNVELGALIAGDKFVVLGEIAAYFFRLAGNAFNLGLRPQMADISGGIYLLGVGYWTFGVILLAGLIWSVRHVLSLEVSKSTLAFAIVVILLGISYSSFVQPRYMMPLIFPLTLGLSNSRLSRSVAVPAGIVFPWVFSALGVLPPLAGG